MMEVEVIEAEVPLLIGLPTMKKVNMVIETLEDIAILYGQTGKVMMTLHDR